MVQKAHFMVVGANGAIGSEVCRRLVAAGRHVTLAGRNESALRRLGEELQSPVHVVDATSIEQMESCVQQSVEASGPLRGIVNCVGSLLIKPMHLTTLEEWQTALTTNLTSAFVVVRSAVAAMSEGGSIVLISSAAARTGLPNHEAIAAAKAGIIGLALSAAATYAQRNVRLNVVAPGLIRTPLTERIWRSDKAAEASLALHPLGRLGEAADVASLISWLLQDEASWITGQIIGVDGGLATVKTMQR